MTSPLYNDEPYHFRILPRTPGEGYYCFWACGAPVGGPMQVCEGCKEKLEKASIGMPKEHYRMQGYCKRPRRKHE